MLDNRYIQKKKTALLSMQYFPVRNHLSMRDLLGEKVSVYCLYSSLRKKTVFDRYVGTVGEIEHISGSMLTLRAHMQWVREDVHELLILLHLTTALRGERL